MPVAEPEMQKGLNCSHSLRRQMVMVMMKMTIITAVTTGSIQYFHVPDTILSTLRVLSHLIFARTSCSTTIHPI